MKQFSMLMIIVIAFTLVALCPTPPPTPVPTAHPTRTPKNTATSPPTMTIAPSKTLAPPTKAPPTIAPPTPTTVILPTPTAVPTRIITLTPIPPTATLDLPTATPFLTFTVAASFTPTKRNVPQPKPVTPTPTKYVYTYYPSPTPQECQNQADCDLRIETDTILTDNLLRVRFVNWGAGMAALNVKVTAGTWNLSQQVGVFPQKTGETLFTVPCIKADVIQVEIKFPGYTATQEIAYPDCICS